MDWSMVQQGIPTYEKAFWLTLKLSCEGIVGAIIVGLIVSFVQYFRITGLQRILGAYVELSRNTPLLIQLFFLSIMHFPKSELKFRQKLVV